MYERYKLTIYKYVIRKAPDAGEEEWHRILKSVWEAAALEWDLLNRKTEREQLAWLLAAAEREIRKSVFRRR